MPNGLALENNHWFGPEEIAGLTTAFEAALAKLGLVDRSDPTTLTLAKLIIELAKAGVMSGYGNGSAPHCRGE
jgi:hypothetical protein